MTLASGQPTTPAGFAVPVASSDWQRIVWLGYAILGGALGVFILWATLSRLDGAAVAPGLVSVETNRKTIQHLEGGIIRELLVRDGDLVKEGPDTCPA